MAETQKPTVLFVIGAGSADVRPKQELLEAAFKKQGHELIVIGDGQENVTLKRIGEEVKKLNDAGKPFTFYLTTHGNMRLDKHVVSLGDQMDLGEFFTKIRQENPGAQQFKVTFKHGDENYLHYDRKYSFDTTQPMTAEQATAAITQVRGMGLDDITLQEEEDGLQMPYGDPGFLGMDDKPVSVQISPVGSDKVYTLPFTQQVKTEELFATIAQNSPDVDMSIFNESCYGGGACLHVNDTLPKGTVFASLSSGYEPVFVDDTNSFLSYLQRSDDLKVPLNAQNLAMLYVQYGVSHRDKHGIVEPVIAVSGSGIVDTERAVTQLMQNKPEGKAAEVLIARLMDGGPLVIKDAEGKPLTTIQLAPYSEVYGGAEILSTTLEVPSADQLHHLYPRAMALALANTPAVNRSFDETRATRDFTIALDPAFAGDRSALLQSAIDQGVDPLAYAKRSDGGLFRLYTHHDNAMELALRLGDEKLVQLLADKGLTISEDQVLDTATRGNPALVFVAMDRAGKKFDDNDGKFGHWLLARAISAKDRQMFDTLEERGAKIAPSGPSLISALLNSGYTGHGTYDPKTHLSFLKHLVEKRGVKVYTDESQDGSTYDENARLLVVAGQYGGDTFNYLLPKIVAQSGKSESELFGIKYKPSNDNTIVHNIAQYGDDPNVLLVILKHRPKDVNQPGDSGDSPLWQAVSRGNYGMANVLVAHGADVNVARPREGDDLSTRVLDGRSVRKKEDRLKMVKLLLENGYDPYRQVEVGQFHSVKMDLFDRVFTDRYHQNHPEMFTYVRDKELEMIKRTQEYQKATNGKTRAEIAAMFDSGALSYTPVEMRQIIMVTSQGELQKTINEDNARKGNDAQGYHRWSAQQGLGPDLHNTVRLSDDQVRGLSDEIKIQTNMARFTGQGNAREIARAYGEYSGYADGFTEYLTSAEGKDTLDQRIGKNLEHIRQAAGGDATKAAAILQAYVTGVTEGLKADGSLSEHDQSIIQRFRNQPQNPSPNR